MRNLLNFLIKYSSWFLLVFYIVLSALLLFSNNAYQQSVYLTSANSVSSAVYGTATNITDYFNLRSINNSLRENNARLSNEVLNLKAQLAEYRTILGDTAGKGHSPRFSYVAATVLNNSLRMPRNYFTINKGTDDGITTGMGVVDHQGVVGIVNVAGKHTARVISLLNESQHFSVKIKDTPYVGTLTWHGNDPRIAYMEEVPQHVKYHTGDTIVTSGFSTTFPEGIAVGTVMNRVKMPDDNFYVIKVRLASDFKTMSAVRVIKDTYKNELDSLRQFDLNE